MNNINDKATVSLFVNGEQAKAAMKRLRDEAEDLKAQLEGAMAAGDKKSANQLQRRIDKVTKELNRTESAAKGTRIVLDNLANTSIHGLQNALKYLERELRMTNPNSERWKEYASQINDVKKRIAELNKEMEGGQSLWSRFKKWADDTWPAIDLLSRGYSQVVSTLRVYVDAYASMDQEMANVRKFTGLTAEQVEDLNEEFKKMDTRTSREDLNKLAQEAGRLGKTSKEDILGFVRAADQINVALDDLGEGATLTLSKLTGVFGDEARYGTEQALLKVGSVINELSQNCSASASYLAQFASRMGGVGAQAKMTIPQIMAFGAVLDSNGQAVEASSTALSQVIVRMMQEPAKYAKVAGLDVKQFTEMLKTDVNGALIMFLETLQKAGGMDVLSPMFKDMGENGSRAIAALSTLATHINEVKTQQEAASVAFREGTSIGQEFAVQNTTVQASLEKAKKSFQELRVDLGEKLSPLMAHIISSTSAMARVISLVVDFCIKYHKEILSVVAVVAAYNLAVKAQIIYQTAVNGLIAAGNTLFAAARPLILAAQVAYLKLTGQTRLAAVAQCSLNNALKLNPLGLLLASITAAVGAIITYTSRAKEAAKAQEELNRKQQEFRDGLRDTSEAENKYAADEQKRAKILYEAATNETISREKRLDAVKKLQQLYPDYFGNLSAETIMAGKAESAYNNLAASILKTARMRAAADKIVANEDKRADLQDDYDDATSELLALQNKKTGMVKQRNAILDWIVSPVDKRGESPVPEGKSAGREMQRLDWEIAALDNQITNLIDKSRELSDQLTEIDFANDEVKERAGITDEDILASRQRNNPELTTTSTNVPSSIPATSTSQDPKPDRFAAEKAWRESEEAKARIAYAKGEATYSEHTARMSTIAADYYDKLLDRADVFGDERLKIEAEYEESVKKKTEAFNKKSLDDENREYQDLLDRLRSNHQQRLEQEGMSAKERQRELEYYVEVTELAELNHLRNILDIYKEGSDEWLEAQRNLQQKEIDAQERHLKKMEQRQQEYADIKKKVFGMNQDEKDSEFTRQFDALTAVYNQELAAVGDNEAEKLRIKEAYMAAELALRKEYNQAGAEDSKNTYETAIGDSVKWLQGDGGKALTGTLSTLTSGMSSIFSGLSSMMQAELEIQTSKIEKRYSREVELAQGNSYKVAKLEKQKEKEIAMTKNEANRKMFAMQVIQAVAQTATNALSAYGSAAAVPVVGYILAPIAAAMAVAAGAIQIAAIKKQQQASEAQGYSKGGFTKPGRVDEPAGIVHAGEWVASQKLLANPVARPMIEALDLAQRTNTIGSLKPEDVSRSIRANDSLARVAESDEGYALMAAAAAHMSRTVANLTDRLNEPFVTVNTVAGELGSKQAEDRYKRLMNNITPKSKRS